MTRTEHILTACAELHALGQRLSAPAVARAASALGELDLQRTSVHREMVKLVDAGWLERTGEGTAARYEVRALPDVVSRRMAAVARARGDDAGVRAIAVLTLDKPISDEDAARAVAGLWAAVEGDDG